MIYLATPLFSRAEQDYALKLTEKLEKIGHIVYYPWRDAGDEFYKRLYSNDSNEWHKNIFTENIEALHRAQIVIALTDGADVDSGVAWEVGFAIANKKTVYTLRSDFRTHTGSGSLVNLMVECSAQQMFFAEDELVKKIDNLSRPKVATIYKPFEFYDSIAMEYDDALLHPRTAHLRKLAEAAAHQLIPQQDFFTALDIGGGTGRLIGNLENVRTALVIDPSKEMLLQREDVDKVARITSSFESFDTPEKRFDLITCLLAVDHIRDINNFIARISTMLKHNGHFVIVYQDVNTEIANRVRPDYFCFDSANLDTRFFVKSEIKKLIDLPSMLSEKLKVCKLEKISTAKWRVAPLIAIHCTNK